MLQPADLLRSVNRWPRPPIHRLTLPGADGQLDVLRLDLLHPQLGGNKAFKLRHHLRAARAAGKKQLLSFGGVWSNHLRALAVAGPALGFETHAVLRGEDHADNPVLALLRRQGLQLHFISRADYRAARSDLSDWALRFPGAWMIPEGGADALGVAGAAEIQRLIPADYRSIICAAGTATTLAGLLQAAPAGQFLLGLAVLKGADFLAGDLRGWLQAAPAADWRIETRFHCGGYARQNQALREFMGAFVQHNDLPIEPVYTGKALYGLQQYRLGGGYLPEPALFLHTGGIF
jgi:1-aminocyclopropane-1-carboxylate deaminase/D-cysteine desulfhydrase-like pyridoxal-dependent ACC family enzyme